MAMRFDEHRLPRLVALIRQLGFGEGLNSDTSVGARRRQNMGLKQLFDQPARKACNGTTGCTISIKLTSICGHWMIRIVE
jgi:hypothetical protein